MDGKQQHVLVCSNPIVSRGWIDALERTQAAAL